MSELTREQVLEQEVAKLTLYVKEQRQRIEALEKQKSIADALMTEGSLTIDELRRQLASAQADAKLLATDIIERERDKSLLIAERDVAQAEVSRLERRLEIDHAFDTDGKEIVIPKEEREQFPDGITCRDATIQLQDEAIDKLEQHLAQVTARCKELEECLSQRSNIISEK